MHVDVETQGPTVLSVGLRIALVSQFFASAQAYRDTTRSTSQSCREEAEEAVEAEARVGEVEGCLRLALR